MAQARQESTILNFNPFFSIAHEKIGAAGMAAHEAGVT